MVELLEKILGQKFDFYQLDEKLDEARSVLESLLGELSEKEEAVIRFRYLPKDNYYQSNHDTARYFRVSDEEIEEVFQSAILKLKHPNRRQKLADLLLVKHNYKITINNSNGGEDRFWEGSALFEDAYKKFYEAIIGQPRGSLFKSVHFYRDGALLFNET